MGRSFRGCNELASQTLGISKMYLGWPFHIHVCVEGCHHDILSISRVKGVINVGLLTRDISWVEFQMSGSSKYHPKMGGTLRARTMEREMLAGVSDRYILFNISVAAKYKTLDMSVCPLHLMTTYIAPHCSTGTHTHDR